jgi:hypothetical protein
VIARLQVRSKAPLAVAGILVTPLFFSALMAMSLAVEKPTVSLVVKHGKTITRLGDPAGTTEARIWLLAILPPVAVVLVGAGAMLLGRAGVTASAIAAIGAAAALLAPLDGWRDDHVARYPVGVDLIPRSAGSEDIYLRGEWESTARQTALQLGIVTVVIAALVLAVFALLEVRRRRGRELPAPPPPPPLAVEGQAR